MSVVPSTALIQEVWVVARKSVGDIIGPNIGLPHPQVLQSTRQYSPMLVLIVQVLPV
jgi:hypothetical protein